MENLMCKLGCGRVNTTKSFRCEGCGNAARKRYAMSLRPMGPTFVGTLTFVGSEKLDRETNVMSFEVMCDWAQSVDEFFRQAVILGDYDGSEVVVTIFEYSERIAWEGHKWDKESMIDQFVIDNPHYDCGFVETEDY